MKYKGKYLANVAIDVEIKPDGDRTRPFDEMKKLFEHELTPELERVLRKEFYDDEITSALEVVQMQAELWKEDEESETE